MKGFFAAAAVALSFLASKVSASPLFERTVSAGTCNVTSCNITTNQLTANISIFTPPFNQILYTQLYYANSSAYIGQIRYAEYSEPLIIDAGGSFLSQHQAPTGFQYAYVFAGQSTPISWTVPHGPVIPEGASAIGFNFTNGLWGVNGTTNKWALCPVSFADDGNWTIAQVWYQGGAVNTSCVPVNLTQYVYGAPGGTEAF